MYYFIVNKTAGNGKGLRVWEATEKLLKGRKVVYKVSFTEYKGHAGKLMEQIDDGLTAIIVVGGDGTIHEVVNRLVSKEVALGVVPAGSGNDLARSLGVPFDAKGALDRILAGEIRSIDIPKVGEEYFISIAGLGFDGKVAEVTNKSKSKRFLNKIGLGGLSYIINIFQVLFTYKSSKVSLIVDGKIREYEDVWLMAIANLPYYGGGIMICPDAKGDDGLFDVCVVSGIGRWELLFVFPLAFKGKHVFHRHVTMLRGSSISVIPDKPLIMQCDGEIVQTGSRDFKMERNRLRVL